MKIDLPLWDREARDWRVVEAELVDVAPHLPEATFAVHRCPWSEKIWTVTNVESGCQINHGVTRPKAIVAARERLAIVTVADYERALLKVRRYGVPL